jgi:rod shape determining protein RodA
MTREINIFKSIDWITISLYVLLLIIGWLNIFSSCYNEETSSILNFTERYGKQFIWIISSLVIAIIILFTNTNYYTIFSYLIYATIILINIAVLLIGKEINGQKAWFEIGWVRIQPSEFLKFATCLALAKFMSKKNFQINNKINLLIISFITLLPLAIILLQKDTGTALVFLSFVFMFYREGLTPIVLFSSLISIILFIMSLLLPQNIIIYTLIIITLIIFFLFNGNYKYLLYSVVTLILTYLILTFIEHFYPNNLLSQYHITITALIFSLIAFIITFYKKIKYGRLTIALFLLFTGYIHAVNYIFNNVLEPHQQARINELLGKSNDIKGTGYNVMQSKIAIGSGGLTGKGFLQGTQTKYNFVPEQTTDFIFCTIGEEYGFLGSTLFLILYSIFLIRLIYIAERQRLAFSRIYGYGVISIFLFHFIINIGMTIGLVPVIGIPLPFISYGGSSLWAFTILLFIFIKLDAERFKYLA